MSKRTTNDGQDKPLSQATMAGLGEEAARRGITAEEIEALCEGLSPRDIRTVNGLIYAYVHKMAGDDDFAWVNELKGAALVDAMEQTLEERGVFAAMAQRADG